MRRIDTYRHLDSDDPLTVEIDMDWFADKLIDLNYGVHRLLSSITRQRLLSDPNDELALGIKELLNKGLC